MLRWKNQVSSEGTIQVLLHKNADKVNIFCIGHKILRNLPLTFDCMYTVVIRGHTEGIEREKLRLKNILLFPSEYIGKSF